MSSSRSKETEAKSFSLETERLVLRSWRPADLEPFAAMKADPVVMDDLGGPLSRQASDAKYERFEGIYREHGFTRWVVAEKSGPNAGLFIGYTGVVPVETDHPLGAHYDIGWRLSQAAWGNGYAHEAARAALDDVFQRIGVTEVVAYTSPTNTRSQSVMGKLGLNREADRDFSKAYPDVGLWQAMVWSARPTGDDVSL